MTPFMTFCVKIAATWSSSLKTIFTRDVLAAGKKSLMTRKITAATGGVRRMTILITTSAISLAKESAGSDFESLFYN
jgi:hypothetical protein